MFRPVDRRSLLATLGSLTGLAALEFARPAAAFAEAARAPMPDGPWDLTWLDGLKGKHKQVFDTGNLDLTLIVVTNYLDAANEVFGLSYPDVNTVVGIGGSAFPYNANDAIWAKYEVGRRWKVKDPATNEWATKNIFLEATPMGKKMVGVKALVARGTIFWQCNNALNHIVRDIAADTKLPVDQVRAELVAGLNPWVKLVPAHTLLIGLSQEHGCTYESLG
jgi:hypothetical protein